jgi:pyruvate-formate lyase-activating enzyme
MAARAELSHLFCSLPWSYAEVHADGRVFMCCPRYSGLRAIGNLFKSTPEAIWNSRMAERIRRGILDASFSHCSHRECPELVGRSLERRADAERHPEIGPLIRDNATALAKGPATVKLCHDESCNLSCPSCRKETIVANRARQAKLDRMLNDFVLPFLKDTRLLILSGDGDPFASKHYRDVLKATAERLPQLKIGLHTNGVLFDARAWADCRLAGRVDQVEVSIDAADPLTYGLVRRGGDFARLLGNLDFLAAQRRAGMIRYLMLSFVVQGANFREMPAFVALGRRLGVDRVRFTLIRPWRRGLGNREYAKAMIWDEAHPEFDAFLATLRDPALADPIVWATDVVPFIERARGAPLDLGALKPTPIERLRNWLGG